MPKAWPHSGRDIVRCNQLIDRPPDWPKLTLPACNRVIGHPGPCRFYDCKTFEILAEQPSVKVGKHGTNNLV